MQQFPITNPNFRALALIIDRIREIKVACNTQELEKAMNFKILKGPLERYLMPERLERLFFVQSGNLESGSTDLKLP